MNIIARAALYLYDGSQAAPIFPDKVGKPGDEAAAYLSTVADKLMASDGSRTTCVEPNSAQEEMLRRFILTPFQEAADALMRSMDETMQALEIPREGFDMAIFSFEKDGNPHLCVAQLPYRGAMVHRLDVAEDGTTDTQVVPFGTVLPLPGSKGCSGFVVNLSTGDIRLRDAHHLVPVVADGHVVHALAGRRAGDCRGRAVRDGHPDADPDGQARDEQIHRGKGRDRREGRGGGGLPLRP